MEAQKNKRKILLLDIDDVILDFAGNVIDLINLESENKVPVDVTPTAWSYGDWSEKYGIKKELITESVDKAISENKLKALPGAKDLLRTAQSLGWEIHLITAHFHSFYVERVKNLKAEKLTSFDSLHFTASFDKNGNKVKFAKDLLVRANNLAPLEANVIFVDDKMSAVIDMINQFPHVKGISLDRDFNFEDMQIIRQTEYLSKSLEIISGNNRFEQIKNLYSRILEMLEETQ